MTLTKYKALLHEEKILSTKVRTAREKLAKKCKHPAEFVTDTSEQRSNGYGSWHKHEYRVCGICFSEEHWGRWINKETIRRSHEERMRNDD